MTRLRSAITSITEPVTPLSLPAMTLTWSPFLMLTVPLRAMSEHLRCERDDAHELLVAKLAPDGSEDARAARVSVRLEDHCCVLVELDVRAIGTTALLDGPHDDSLDDFTLLDVSAGDGVLDGGDDGVTDAGITPTRATEHTDAKDLLGTGVVCDLESRLLLNHRSSPTWPSRGSRRCANAWWRTVDASP